MGSGSSSSDDVGNSAAGASENTAVSSAESDQVSQFMRLAWRAEAVRALHILLKNPKGRKVFCEYLESEHYLGAAGDAIQSLFVNMECEAGAGPTQQAMEISAAFLKRYDKDTVTGQHMNGKDGAESFDGAGSLHERVTEGHGTTFENTRKVNEMQSGVIGVLAVRFFPAFIRSDMCATLMTQLNDTDDDTGSASGINELKKALANPTLAKADENANASDKEIKLMAGGGWLGQLARLSEHLPFCVCVSDSQAVDFPLIYVNKQFERVTGYTQAEIVGRNCRFLTGPETEPWATEHIVKCLTSHQECYVAITNYRQMKKHPETGKPVGVPERFKNYLSMKPVFDKSEPPKLRFYIGVQFDISQLDSMSAADATFVIARHGQLLSVLPNTC